MNNLVWKDTTSYGRGEKDRKPRVLELRFEKLIFVLHQHIHYDGWLVSCNQLGIDKERIYSVELEAAKKESIKLLDEILINKISEYYNIQLLIREGTHE